MSSKVIASNLEVVGASVQVIIQSLGRVKDMGLRILQENGVDTNVKMDGWVNMEKFIKSLDQIGVKFGPNTLYMVGKTVPEIIKFPSTINSFESAMGSINISYLNSHKNLDKNFAYYKFTKLNDNRAIIEAENPYPSEFDRGLITGLGRKFPPKNMKNPVEVILDPLKPTRRTGAKSCTYIITW